MCKSENSVAKEYRDLIQTTAKFRNVYVLYPFWGIEDEWYEDTVLNIDVFLP